ncbi:MAG TPA: hypothetical protein VF235_00595 [Actinomycetota bacterium]
MRTEIQFIGGEHVEFGEGADIKMTPLGVEIRELDGEEAVRVLFPWARIEKVTQRGAEVSAIYTY